uniref:Uncharacterized protein n=1 Tax=Lotharella globosa TaxID=91324 RepID=A0A7S3Z0D3_9EUKA
MPSTSAQGPSFAAMAALLLAGIALVSVISLQVSLPTSPRHAPSVRKQRFNPIFNGESKKKDPVPPMFISSRPILPWAVPWRHVPAASLSELKPRS